MVFLFIKFDGWIMTFVFIKCTESHPSLLTGRTCLVRLAPLSLPAKRSDSYSYLGD